MVLIAIFKNFIVLSLKDQLPIVNECFSEFRVILMI